MNLWARSLRQLAVLAVALFFFSCEDETSILGFKNPNKKFKVNYVDIPLESSVFLLDSLRTSNFFGVSETNRLLVGKYVDDQFGEISATAITQYFTANSSKTLLKETAVFDSVSIELQFDFYSYGSIAPTMQTINVHEVQNEIKIDSTGNYFNKSRTGYDPTPIGSKSYAIAPDLFKDLTENPKDTSLTINFPLDPVFGQKVFASAMRYRNSSTAEDSAFVTRDFFKEFNGLALVPGNADKIIGFNPGATASKIVLHYHDAETDSLALNLTMRVFSFNEITANFASTELASLTQYSQPIAPENKRFVQSGTGVMTRLDFKGFYDFVDADSNSAMIVNSAELHLGAAEPSAVFLPITSLSLRAMKGEAYLKRVVDPAINKAQHLADSASVTLYAGQLGVSGGMFTPLGADGTIFRIAKVEDDIYYNGFLTLFAQQVFKKEENKERFRYFALYPETPPVGKSVNRIIFNKQNIKIRVYYTRPTQPLQ
ncbi:MAG: DUF4270 family protein [Cyclobacteriaceae bacterium]